MFSSSNSQNYGEFKINWKLFLKIKFSFCRAIGQNHVRLTAVERNAMEMAAWVDTVAEGEKYLRAHPSHQGAPPISHQPDDSQQSIATVKLHFIIIL